MGVRLDNNNYELKENKMTTYINLIEWSSIWWQDENLVTADDHYNFKAVTNETPQVIGVTIRWNISAGAPP